MCSGTQQATNLLSSNLVGEWSNSSKLEVLKQSRWLVFAMRVTFNEHNLSIIGTCVEHNSNFGAVQHSIIEYFLSIVGSALHYSVCIISHAGHKHPL